MQNNNNLSLINFKVNKSSSETFFLMMLGVQFFSNVVNIGLLSVL